MAKVAIGSAEIDAHALALRYGTTDALVFSFRAARRYRSCLAGGRFIGGGGNVHFAPNRLEGRRSVTHWECTADDVTGCESMKNSWG